MEDERRRKGEETVVRVSLLFMRSKDGTKWRGAGPQLANKESRGLEVNARKKVGLEKKVSENALNKNECH